MTDQSMSLTTERSTPPLSTNTPTITDNNSSTFYNSTSTGFPSSVLDEIKAADIISRANYTYSFFASLGFIAGCFLLYSFIQTYRAQRRLAWLQYLIWAFCVLQLLLLFFSLHAVAYRPHYLKTTALGCAALSFFINTISLCGLFVLVLMAYVLSLEPPSHAPLRKPRVCMVLVILISVLISLLLAGIRGPHNSLHEKSDCFMDPAEAGVLYAVAKLCLALLIPYILQLGLLIGGCVRQWNSRGRFLSGSEEGPMFLTVTLVMFLCLLIYNVMLLRGAQLQKKLKLTIYEQAYLSVGEFVLFAGSSASLLLVLFMHRPCRESLHEVFRQLTDCCQSPGRTQPNRNIIAPRIEITDTLQDIES